jgi:hypothetical protein
VAAFTSTILVLVSFTLAGFLVIGVVWTLWELGAGHIYAGSDPAGFGMALGWTLLGALAGIGCAGIGLLVYRPAWVWSVSALVLHTCVLVANQIAHAWNCRLEARERLKEERARDRTNDQSEMEPMP